MPTATDIPQRIITIRKNMKLPKEIEKLVSEMDFEMDTLGRSNDEIYIFREKYVLKCSRDVKRLGREYSACEWLWAKLPVPKPICFAVDGKRAFFLREKINGKPLCSPEYIKNPEIVVELLSSAFLMLRGVDAKSCPFNSPESQGDDFVHGDLCLPNILVSDNKVSGFIDLENCGCGDKYFDLSWAVWSMEYNLGTSAYNEKFLRAIGCQFSPEKYKKYVLDVIENLENNSEKIKESV